MQSIKAAFVVLLTALVVGCGGGSTNSSSTTSTTTSSTTNPQSVASFQGQQWEFALTSDNSSWTTTLIEAAMNQSGNQLTASSTGSETLTVQVNNGVWTFPTQTQPNVSGTISGTTLSLTFSEPTGLTGPEISAQGTIGKGVITGTWQSGNLTGELSGRLISKPVSALTGPYAGTLNIIGNYCNPTPNCTATPTGPTSTELSLTAKANCSSVSGVCYASQGTITLGAQGMQFDGFAAGNASTGGFQYVTNPNCACGVAYAVVVYYDQTGKYTGTPNSIAVMDQFDGGGSGLLSLQ